MSRSQNEGLAQAPLFTPHRVAVTAADAVAPSATIVKKHGVDGRLFDEVVADVDINAGTSPSWNLEVLLWSDLDGNFLKQEPAVTFAAVTASRILRFKIGGQRFFIHAAGTPNGSTLNINVAGVPPIYGERA